MFLVADLIEELNRETNLQTTRWLSKQRHPHTTKWLFREGEEISDYTLQFGNNLMYLRKAEDRLLILHFNSMKASPLTALVAKALQTLGFSGSMFCPSNPGSRQQFFPLTKRDQEMLSWIPSSASFDFEETARKGNKLRLTFPHCQVDFGMDFKQDQLIIQVGDPDMDVVKLSTKKEADAFFARFLAKEAFIQKLSDQLLAKAKTLDPEAFYHSPNIYAFQRAFQSTFVYEFPLRKIVWTTQQITSGKTRPVVCMQEGRETDEQFAYDTIAFLEKNLRRARMQAVFEKKANSLFYEVAVRTSHPKLDISRSYAGTLPLPVLEEKIRVALTSHGVTNKFILADECRRVKDLVEPFAEDQDKPVGSVFLHSLGEHYLIYIGNSPNIKVYFEPRESVDTCLEMS